MGEQGRRPDYLCLISCYLECVVDRVLALQACYSEMILLVATLFRSSFYFSLYFFFFPLMRWVSHATGKDTAARLQPASMAWGLASTGNSRVQTGTNFFFPL